MEEKWWHSAVIYQIYPKSFKDTNGDGIGDIYGIIEKLDYLKLLGVSALWICPMYQSPNVDNGYDISDYYTIDPIYGGNRALEKLIYEASLRNIRIIMDLVLNHTSNKHIWFKKALDGNRKYQDYYIFKDKNSLNDIKSFFGGSAWEQIKNSDMFYFHLFAAEQPDLNWKNPNMRNELYDMINYWIEKGIGGFRLDVIDLIGKDTDKSILGNGPKLHEYIKEMNKKTFGNCELITVGETGSVTPETAPLYTSPDRDELSMIFQFQHMALDEIEGKTKWDLKHLNIKELKSTLSMWQTNISIDTWNSLFWSNHDQPRIVSRWGNELYHVESAKMLAIILHFMRGTPYIFQGEEIGMLNRYVHSLEELNDIEAINYVNDQLSKGTNENDIWKSVNAKCRDNARTPMQWDSTLYAGFSKNSPWIPVNPNYLTINVEANINDINSIFYTYKKLIALRKKFPIIIWGSYELIETEENVFAYIRHFNDDKLYVIANFSELEVFYTLPIHGGELLISNYANRERNIQDTKLQPYEAFAILVKSK
ncbi:alpha,alpha-phosphotrehalase [Aerococcaceae bacterium zg-BR22]|uniref:alpha,alpha-phosphotrehalase n=1 Tax=Aerococcaceae bacterium zg-1292 TaxID=2774330 RepID=UPI004063E579|nr:alpha,alpha-phosphotrehalase [Aerococcaceae bacterium zg-BR22]